MSTSIEVENILKKNVNTISNNSNILRLQRLIKEKSDKGILPKPNFRPVDLHEMERHTRYIICGENSEKEFFCSR